jgi:epoxide hydrolase-like predicted phosphatase
MITTIIFDLGETYINGVPGLEKRLEPILGRKAAQIYSEIQGEDLLSFFRGEISENEYWGRAIRSNKWNASPATLRSVVRENFYEMTGTRKIIEALKAKGFRLGLLSVHGKEWIEHCENKFDYRKLFDSVEYSFEAGVCKPERKAYERILRKLGAKPGECLFIDDVSKNLPPAEALGIKTILFRTPAQLKKDLASFGIEI